MGKAKGDKISQRNISKIKEEFLDCRDLGHNWKHLSTEENKLFRHFIRTVICTVCDTERVQTVDFGGYLNRSRYRYVKDYLISGKGPLTVDDRAKMRLRNIKRNL